MTKGHFSFRLRGAVATAALLLLGGCWVSNGPLMPEWAKQAPPIADGVWERIDTPDAPMIYASELRGKQIDLSRKWDDGQFHHEDMLSFAPLPNGEWLVQADDGGKETYYFLMTVNGNSLHEIGVSCQELIRTKYADGEDDGHCVFASYDHVRRAAEAAAGEISAGTHPADFVTDEHIYVRR